MDHHVFPILLIEDDPSLSGSLCQFLGDHGYEVACACTARNGWDLLSELPPGLCLLDLNLPDGSGLALFQRLAARQSRWRIVVMTAFDLAHLRPADPDGMLVAWLTKPVNPAELLRIVSGVVGPGMSR